MYYIHTLIIEIEMEMELLEAEQSANGYYKYNQKIYYMTLDSWAQESNIFNCISNNWAITPLKRGSFGYDNLVVSLGHTLINCNNYTDNIDNIEIIADLIHKGWTINYSFWRDNCPWNNTVYKYYEPSNPLNDERRNNCAILDYRDLSQYEKDKDIILAKFLIKKINEIIEYIV